MMSFQRILAVLAYFHVTISFNSASAESVCYGNLGCFDDSLPCHRQEAPESPSRIRTQFSLYTPENPTTPETIRRNSAASIRRSNFRAQRETKFIIHGFNDEGMDGEFLEMKDALLSIGRFNVIIVDWSRGARLIDLDRLCMDLTTLPSTYCISAQNTRVVGREIGQLSEKLRRVRGAAYSSMHLIGHSLGAQIAGYAGEYLSGQYGRITGLDPAGPGFEGFTEPGCLLEETDAVFVDIIHTDTVFGNEDAVGHQDFYPNGGEHQVSCIPLNHICYHLKAVDYFTESITTGCQFRAFPCSSWAKFLLRKCRRCDQEDGCPRMGYFADTSPARGTYMLGTATTEPYCLADSGVPPDLWRQAAKLFG